MRFPALDGNHDLSIFPMVQHLDPHLIPIVHHYKAHRLVRRVVSRCMWRSWGALFRVRIHRSSARDWRDPYWLRLAGSILDGSSSFHAQWLAPVNASSSAFKRRKTTKTKFQATGTVQSLFKRQPRALLPTTQMYIDWIKKRIRSVRFAECDWFCKFWQQDLNSHRMFLLAGRVMNKLGFYLCVCVFFLPYLWSRLPWSHYIRFTLGKFPLLQDVSGSGRFWQWCANLKTG